MKKSGFTLIELSIVIVIIGLIVGGVLVGQDLIRAAQQRAFISEKERYQTAEMTFRLKYNGLPGDLINATMFWPEAASGNACATHESSDTETCNGNGDGIVGGVPAYPLPAYSIEMHRYWQHLANAGLISGQYTGTKSGGANSYSIVLGVNAPESRFPKAGWSRFANANDIYTFAVDYSQLYHYGGQGSNFYNNTPVFTAAEALVLDEKIDDGRPATGKIVSNYWPMNTCTTASTYTDTSAEYRLASGENVVCSFFILNN